MDLTQQHLALLRAAAGRSDALLHCPAKLVGAARRRMADRLLAAGVAEAVTAGRCRPPWFRSREGDVVALRITATGRTVAVDNPDERDSGEADPLVSAPATGQGRAHRPGTKRALLLDLLGREGGATTAVLVEATGWQPHTVRAALTRLRQDGVAIDRVPGEGTTTYRRSDRGEASASLHAGGQA